MKRLTVIILIFAFCLSGCSSVDNKRVEDGIDKVKQEINSLLQDVNSKILSMLNKNGLESGTDPEDGPEIESESRDEIEVDSSSRQVKVKDSSQIAGEMNKANIETNSYDEFYDAVYDAMKNFEKSIYIKIKGYDEKTYNLDVVNSILDSYYDIDYGLKGINGTVYTMGDNIVMKIEFSYSLSREQMVEMREASNKKAGQIIAKIIKPGMSDLKKELAIHNYIVNNTSYNYKDYKDRKLLPEAYTDYGVLVKGSAVCEGYAKAMQKLLRIAGIECIAVKGDAEGVAHAWNIVKINGKYCHVDVTWDDPVTADGRDILSYKYYNLSDSQMAKDHQWDSNKYPKCTTKEFNRKK